MKAAFKKLFANIFSILISLYFIVSIFVFIPYYNWDYVKTHGFKKWLILGEVFASAKAFTWPYYVFVSFSSDDTPSHVTHAIDYSNKATAIINKGGPQYVSQSDMNQILAYYTKALEEAKKADINYMNKRYQGFGDHFKNEFIGGLELFIKSSETRNMKGLIASQVLLQYWGDWFDANIEGIRHIKK